MPFSLHLSLSRLRQIVGRVIATSFVFRLTLVLPRYSNNIRRIKRFDVKGVHCVIKKVTRFVYLFDIYMLKGGVSLCL